MNSTRRLTCLIPTQGRATLTRTLDSIKPQMAEGDRVIVMQDLYGATREDIDRVQEMLQPYGVQFGRIGHDAGHHCWGHCQVNAGMELFEGDGSWLTYQDDDDVYYPDAWAKIRKAISQLEEPKPMLFRFQSYYGPVYWEQRGVIQVGKVGGHCLVTPNLKGRVGRYSCRYEGDFDKIRSTVELWPRKDLDVVWRDEIISRTRPT